MVEGPSYTGAGEGRGQEAPPLGTDLRRVELWAEPVPTVRLHTTQPITPRVTAVPAEGESPPRLRIVIPARALARARRPIGGTGVVRRITVEQGSPREAAITVTLTKPVGHRVRHDGGALAIELREDADATSAVPTPDPGPVVRSTSDAAGGRDVAITLERGGAPFVWPDLDAPCYADPAAAVERLALKGWRKGGMTPDAPASHTSAAGRYLAADVTYLRTLMGQMEPLDAVTAYDRALRAAPGFADAPRALVMIGFASLRLGLAPEADTAFIRALDEQPGGRYAQVARIGRAAALRARRRFDDARAALAGIAEPPQALRCDVLWERAALARATGRHADAVTLDEGLARDCPRFDVLETTALERAASLLAIGRRSEARALLTRGVDGLDVGAQATLLVRAAELAREDDDLVATRDLLERALGMRIGPAARTGIQARLARLDGVVSPERAVASLEALAASAPTSAARADVVGLIAETFADADRFDDALARLVVPADGTAADRDAVLEHRSLVLARWVERLEVENDSAGIVTVYAQHRTTFDTHASGPAARRVASALGRMRLPEPALRVLRLRDQDEDPAHVLALAGAALDAGEPALARDTLARLDAVELAPALLAERVRTTARLAAVDGHPERVATEELVGPLDAALGRELGRAWIARGEAAGTREAWDVAAQAFERAHTLAPDAAARLVATAGLVAARAATDAKAAADAADGLAAIDDAVIRRAVTAVAATRQLAAIPAAIRAEEHGHER